MEWYDHLLGVLLAAAVCAPFVLRAARSPRPRDLSTFAAVHDVPLTDETRPVIAAYLRRGRLLRTLGGSAGYVLSSILTIEAILMILLGYLLGAGVAAATARMPSPGPAPRALLSPRALSRYVAVWKLTLLRGLPVASVLLAIGYAARVPSWPDGAQPARSPWIAVALALGVGVAALGVEALLRVVVGRRQPLVSPDLLLADDALRSSTVHVLLGAGVGAQLVLLSGQVGLFQVWLGEPGATYSPSTEVGLLSIALLAVGYVAWRNLGQPRRAPVHRAA